MLSSASPLSLRLSSSPHSRSRVTGHSQPWTPLLSVSSLSFVRVQQHLIADPPSDEPGAPARIQVLLVPIHPIKRSKFERYAELIRGFGKIPLCDVPGDKRGERAIFSSSPTTPGSLLFSYQTPTTYASSHPLSYLNEFQVHRRIHGIIGILDCSEFDSVSTPSSSPNPNPSTSTKPDPNSKKKPSLQSGIDTFHKNLKELPQTFTNKIYGFEPSSDQIDEGRRLKIGGGEGEEEAIVMVPTTGDLAFYLNTLLADFAGGILWEFSALAAQLESRNSFPTPQETSAAPSPFTYIASKPSAHSSISSYTSTASSGPPPTFNLAPFGIAPPPQSRTALGLFGGSQSGNQDGFLYGMSIASNMQVQKAALPDGGGGGGGGVNGANNGVVDMKARKKVIGREKKLLGDLWLLSGRVGEAIKCYEEAILNTKSWHDSVWQASALEGLCVAMVVQAWGPNNTRFSMQMPTPAAAAPGTSSSPPPTGPLDTSTFLSAIPDKLGQAISLYSKILPSPSPAEDAPPADPDRSNPLIYAEACLRCARFLVSVWETSGWIDRALDRLVLPPTRLRGSPQTSIELAREAKLTSLKPNNTVPRSQIALYVSMAYSPTLVLMSLPIRLRISGEVASLFGRIGYRRKEAFVLRELAALCGEGVAGRGIEVFTTEMSSGKEKEKEKEKEKTGEKERTGVEEESEEGDLATPLGGMKKRKNLSLNKINPLLLVDRTTPSIVRTTSDSAGNDSIIRVAEKVCEAFGVSVVSKAKKAKELEKEERMRKRMSLVQGRAKEIDEDGRKEFGWPILQVGVLRDAISIAEALPDYQAAIRFTVTALRALSATMPPAEQYRLSQNIPRIFAAATRRGAAFELEYWGPSQLVMSLEVAPLLQNRLPSEHSYNDVEQIDSGAVKNPFIYNPNKGPAAAKARPTVVQNEIIEVFVTLQNPFLFDLDVQNIELSTSGVPFACESFSTTVPPGSFHTVRLLGTPREAGPLTIRGCNIRLAGCTNREFLLPVWSDAQEAKRQKASLLDTSRDRVKQVGLDAFDTKSTRENDDEGFKFLECDVVREMPMLWMRSTNLTHGALMLYDGENFTIRIGLENTSPSRVNFLKLTFTDSFTTATQAYVEENDLPPGEAFEILSENLNRPVFTWTGDHDQFIAPGAFKTIEVQCMGKVGCGSGMIQLDYACLDRESNPSSTTFHTRQLFCPVYMTVHRALVGHSLDILSLTPLPPSESTSYTKGHGRSDSLQSLGRRGAALDSRLEEELREPDGDGEDDEASEKCLVVVEIANTYGQPFEVTLERGSDETGMEIMKIRERLEPGATARILLPLPLLRLPLSVLSAPIPSLSTERQFVVSASRRSPEEERMERELFWYREELLKRVKGSWNEVGSLRSGSISLRNLRLTKPMLDLLSADALEIELSLGENDAADSGAFKRIAGNVKGRVRYEARANEFVDVKVRVRNNTADPIKSIFHLFLLAPTPAPPLPNPTANPNAALSHLYRYLVIDGLSTVPLRTLSPGEEEEVRISICLLAEGTWEFKGEIDEVRDGQPAGKEMRKFVGREKLVIEVVE